MPSRLCCFAWSLGILCAAVPAFALSSPREVKVRRALPVSEDSSGSRSTAGNRPSTTTVIIDAGHGGHDRGGIPSQRVAEKTMTLDVAQRLKAVLMANGYRVIMTRDSDVFVPLPT